MTKDEAFKELGIRYVGPNVKAKFFEIIEEYAKERVEEMIACGRQEIMVMKI